MAKKVNKPAFVVDVVDVTKPEAWIHRMNQAKCKAKLPISSYDYNYAVQECGVEGYNSGFDEGFQYGEAVTMLSAETKPVEKKQNVVKRFWNWLTSNK